MHPLRKLRESGKPTAAQVSELLAENVVFNSPILIRTAIEKGALNRESGCVQDFAHVPEDVHAPTNK
jgi:hypothetical protein